jgi:AcrR family transcriptional regulator
LLFAKFGYNATSLDDICSAVSLGRGALYRYIGSKGDLLVEIQNHVLEPLLTKARDIRESDLDPVYKLRLISRVLLSVMTEMIDYVWVYQHDYRALEGAARTRMVSQRHEFEQLVQDIAQAAIDAGQFRQQDAHLVMLQFLNMHNYTYQWWRPSLGLSSDELSDLYCHTLFVGFAASAEVASSFSR